MFLSLPPHPKPPDDIFTGCCMEPVPGPSQCSLQSSLGAARGRAGGCRQLGAKWPGHRKSRVLHTPTLTSAHTAMSMRAEVFTFVQRCGSKCLSQMHRHLCVRVPPEGAIRYCSNSAKPSSCPPNPALAWGVWWRTGQSGTPPISSLPLPPAPLGQ